MLAFDLARIGGRSVFDGLIDTVLEAGEHALSLQRRGVAARAEAKPDRSPVTEADRAVETLLAGYVRSRMPGVDFFGEEHGGDAATAGRLRVLVDPIDGTRAFIRNMPSWSILLAVELDRRPVVAVAYLPAQSELFTAVEGHGAYVDGRPITLSGVAALEDALVCHGGLSQFSEAGLGRLLERIARASYTQRSLADFANYAALLKGSADAVVEPSVQPYDIAAAALLVREAGGRFTSFDGSETVYGSSALASNGKLHDSLVDLLAIS